SSTSRAICASAVSPPTLVASITSRPDVFTVAPNTVSPALTSTGTGSPVSIDMSTADDPSTTRPSVAILSPGRTTKRSPTWRLSTGTSSPFSRRAVLAPSSSSPRSAWLDRLMEGPTGPEDHWRRERERHPLPPAELKWRDHRDQQHRDRKSDRHVQPRAEPAHLLRFGIALLVPLGMRHRIPEPADRGLEVVGTGGARVVDDGGALGAVVGVGLGHAGEPGEP